MLLAACDGGGSPEPGPSPSPTRTPTGSPVTDDDASCPPIPGLTEQLVTIALRASAPLPDGGRIAMAEWKGDSVTLQVVRKTEGCPADAYELDLPRGGGATVRGVKIDVVSVNGPGAGGSVPTVQLRIGPPD